MSTLQRFVQDWKFLAVVTVTLVAYGGAAAHPIRLAALAQGSQADPRVRLQLIASGLARPVYLTHAGDGSGHLFIVEQAGRIRVWVGGMVQARPFLDIADRVTAGGEMGLLSVAFHPQYRSNGRFFVNYTTGSADTRRTNIAEYRAGPRANAADRRERIVLQIRQPYANHNGGLNLFGPDGMLYIGMGDGGSGGDPHNNGQRLDTPLGKLLRIDVDGGTPYRVPPDNPFVGQTGARPEIWAYGLRNPWRFSFDRANGRLFLGDVGQNAWEEIDLIRLGGNYGWRIMEGAHCFDPSSDCDRSGVDQPIAEYSHDLGCSVTGGYVYRGRRIPALVGRYLFGDYCSGIVWTLTETNGRWAMSRLLDTDLNISSFGEDEAGELYVVDHGGRIYKLVPAP